MGPFARIGEEARRRRGEAHLSRGRFAEAAADLAPAAARDPSARVKRGLALWEAGDRAAGLAEAGEGAARLPDAHPARLFWALLLLEEGRRPEADRVLAAVRAEDPGNPFARGLEALASLLAGEPAKAAEALREGVFASPVFRAHLLVAAERHLRRALTPAEWNEAYLETVLP